MPELFKCNLINPKTILLLTADSVSDEALQYPKPLACAVFFFPGVGVVCSSSCCECSRSFRIQCYWKTNESAITQLSWSHPSSWLIRKPLRQQWKNHPWRSWKKELFQGCRDSFRYLVEYRHWWPSSRQ